ncbi:MAG: hypothetical protein H0U92_10805 [Actinobacteria bacterium]|nr:hypothetical protein [Actinomycetota bacterium]
MTTEFESVPAPRRPTSLERVVGSAIAPESPLPVYAGLVLALVGFGLIVYAWSRVAGTLALPVQIPYLLSGGLSGIGLVMLGGVILNIAVKRRTAAERRQQFDTLAALLDRLAADGGDDG